VRSRTYLRRRCSLNDQCQRTLLTSSTIAFEVETVSLTARDTGTGVVDENVLENAVMRANNRHSPHLAPQKVYTFHNGIRQTTESNLVRSSRVVRRVRLFPNPLVPIVSIAVESAGSMAVDLEIVSTEDECC
jgi:hypothetical protein